MISVHICGGLGNALFQVATALSIAKKYNKKLIIPSVADQNCSRTTSYNDSFFHKLSHSNNTNFILIKELEFNYNSIQLTSENNKLFGYFQSEKYFREYKDYILDILSLPTYMINNISQKYNNIIQSDNTVSIHIRRGDYLKFSDIHTVLDLEYYQKAIEYFSIDSFFIIFSDDIEWCKNQDLFKNLKNKQFICDIDYYELYLMSCCKNNIIANSSFSWWGVYMSKYINKKVISPKQWFGINGPQNFKDIYIDNWIII